MLLMALVLPVAGRAWPRLSFPLAAGAVLVSSVASALALGEVLRNGPLSYHIGGWAPPVGIEYVADRVSSFVSLIVTGVSFVVLIATRRLASKTAHDRLGTFYGIVLLLLTGLVGIVMTGDLFNLFVFLEISSLAAYALIFIGGRIAMLAGFRYLVLGTIASSFYLLGVGFIYFSTGTLNMAETHLILSSTEPSRSVQAGAVFIFTGLALKMALVPLHPWLPDAYTYAPSAVSSLIAPVMTKVAAYAILRMFISVFPDGYLTDAVPVANALVILGLIGVVFGSVLAVGQKDFRRMLAYSSISQLALIAIGIGLATPLGFVAALLHIMNHAVMKGTLFLVAASVRLTTGSSNIAGLTGLGRKMPLTMAAFSLGAVAMVGIPPWAGFFSKWYLAQAGVETGQWLVVAVVLGSSLLTAAYLFRVLERIYLQPARPDAFAHSGDGAHRTTHGAPGGVTVAVEARPVIAANTGRLEVKEAPLDVAIPTLFLGAMTVALGIANAVIVTHVLQPGVLRP